MMKTKARVVAFYLPQFHPIPENDKWWGKGFTEWTNVGKAKPLFRGHYQPRVPADLGYYDLRVPETRKAQADMAREYGVEGFCYWHYWFGNGKRLIERPFDEVLNLGEPDFPFCLAWANETWKGFEHGLNNRNILIEQLYPGKEDYTAHFYEVLPAFKDKRYMTVDGKPIFMIYKPLADPEVLVFMDVWRKLALENGLKGIWFVGQTVSVEDINSHLKIGLDAVNVIRMTSFLSKLTVLERLINRFKYSFLKRPRVFEYSKIIKYFSGVEDFIENVYPTIFPNWDHSPRSGKEGLVFNNSNPTLFDKHIKDVITSVAEKTSDNRVVFLKSWNEWAEGNYMEPDMKYGLGYLETLKENIK